MNRTTSSHKLPNLSKSKYTNEPEKKETEYMTKEELIQVIKAFNLNEINLDGASSQFYKKKNTKNGIFMTMKKNFIPPGQILEEVKQKYDFQLRMKEINKRGRCQNLCAAFTVSPESVCQNIGDLMNLNSSINRSSGDSNSPGHLKGALIKVKDYRNRNKPGIMRFNENVVRSTFESQVRMSLNSIEKDECKTVENNSNNNNTNKTTRPGKWTFYDQMKLSEMNSLLSKSKYLNENDAMQNIIKAFIAAFPEKFELNKHYFKLNTSVINSDNKQIQMFLVCLDVISDAIDELITEDKKEEKCLKCMTLLDAIYIDFCKHTSKNSNYRSDFLKKIWVKRLDLMEVVYKLLQSKAAAQAKKIDSILKDNENLTSLLTKNEEEKEELRMSLKIKNRENQKWMEMMIEKDKKEKEIKDKLEELTKLYEDKTRAFEEISSKFHARLNPFIRKNLFGDILNKEDKAAGSESKQNDEKMKNSKLSITETNKKRGIVSYDTAESNANEERKPENIVSHFNLDIKDIIKSRQSRGITQNKNLKERISGNKEGMSSSRKQIQTAVFSIDKEIKQEIINTLASKKQFELYMNKGVNFNGEIVMEKATQTDIEGGHIDEVVTNDIMKTLKTSLQQMTSNLEAMKGMLNSGTSAGEIKEMFNSIHEKNNILNEELYKILEESDIVYNENEKLRSQIDQLQDKEDQMKETYTEIFAVLSDTLKDNNSDIVKFFVNNSEKIKSLPFGREVKEIFTALTHRNIEAVEKCYKGSMTKPTLERLPPESQKDDYEDDDESNNSKSFRGYKMSRQSEKQLTTGFSFKTVLDEFRENYGKIKVHVSMKQTIKIINSIYFEWVEKVYFKNNKVNFDNEEHFVEFGELPLIYFLHNFRLENLVKKKIWEFYQALSQYESNSKRIALFIKIIQLRKKPEDVSTVAALSTFRRSSIKSSTSLHTMTGFINSLHGGLNKFSRRASICINDEGMLCFNVFVSRQLLLFIQYANVNKLLIKSKDENSLFFYLHINKLYDVLLQVYQRLPLTSEMKKKFSLFLEKGKHPFSRNMKTFYVVDFDELLDCIAEVIIELKMVYSKILKTIFSSSDSDSKHKITFFDFLVLHQYVFPQKFSYDHIESIFNAFCEVKHQGDLLSFEMFEAVAIESDFLDMGYFYTYLRVNPDKEMTAILKYLQDELKSSAVSVLDHIMKRMNAIHVQSNPFHTLIASKVQTLKTRIVTSNLDNKDEGTSIWLSIRLIDDLSLELYNEYKFSKIFGELNGIYQELERATCDKINESYIFTYLRKLDVDIHEDIAQLNVPLIDIH